ncbi:hypothetical protein OEZ85_006026 [Tetradesmus obliquus]|uniref:Right handed beta helix domain-containing protein n=1 Tax=Tetradesmus obliquus TaxID=3088 RepID=A0ABY8UKN6_TETOB|nr:hypothetical protein OEZ85_006026 [Tetradesmus obliquus]
MTDVCYPAPVYGAGFYASNGARLLFGGRSSFKGNKGAGGCAIALKNASATFMKPTQIVDNEVIKYLDGSGAALNAETSSIVFNGPVTVARNNNTRGAGGACYLKHSNVTFNAAASVQNNSASGWNGYEDGGNSGGGAICAVESRIVHNNLALYQGNTAVYCSGGALQLQDGSSLVASKPVTFTGNAAMGPSAGSIQAPSYLGGAIYMTRSNVTLTGGASFISNKASPEFKGYGGAICAVGNSTISISEADVMTVGAA